MRAFWVAVHALINTHEHQIKSAQQQAEWNEKSEVERIVFVFVQLLKDKEAKKEWERLQEEIERHHNELKKISENYSLENVKKVIPDDQDWKDIQHIYDLLQTIKNCEARMIVLYQRIDELDERYNDLSKKIEKRNREIEVHKENIVVLDARIRERDDELKQAIHEILKPLYTGKVTHLDLSKVSDDPWFIELIRRGIEIININHANIAKNLEANLFQNKPTDKDTIKKIVNELAKETLSELINACYRDLSREERERLAIILENSASYKEEVGKIVEKIMVEVDEIAQEKLLQHIKQNQVAQEPDYAQRTQEDIAAQKKESQNEKDNSILEKDNREREEINAELREQAKKREAALKRLSQKKQLAQQSSAVVDSDHGSETKSSTVGSTHSPHTIEAKETEGTPEKNPIFIKKRPLEQEKEPPKLPEKENKKDNKPDVSNDASYPEENTRKLR